MDMKVSRERATRNREAVVDAASRLFRAQGIEGAGIAAIMAESGLTHGGFYKQFGSKDALAAEACACALDRSARHWRGIVDRAGDDALDAIAEDYLSPRNRDLPERGCALIALGADAARRGGALAAAFRGGMDELAQVLQEAGTDRADALARLSQLVGAMVLARAVDDQPLSEEIMAATRRALATSADRTEVGGGISASPDHCP
jgi:TetR/AcrR family transcriptional regulator, transcriptional repressor for nem operon